MAVKRLHACVHACSSADTIPYYYNSFTVLWILSGTTWENQYWKKHSSTHTYSDHLSSFICFLHLLRSTASCLFSILYVPDSLFAQPVTKSSLVYLLVWHNPLHTPYISSTNHCLLFTAHTIATCFAVVIAIEQGLTSHKTHYRSYWGLVFMGQMTQPTVSKH